MRPFPILASLVSIPFLFAGAAAPAQSPAMPVQPPARAADPNGPPGALAQNRGPAQQDPKALEILKEGIKALGGEKAILGRTSVYVKRKVINHEYPDPREGTITLYFKRPDKIRKEVIYPGRKTIEAFDGERAWFDHGDGPQLRGPLLTGSIRDGISELDVPAIYLDAELTYFNISQEIPGKLAHVVKVRRNGYTRELMFNVESYLLEISYEYENPWGATDKMIKFDQYRPVEGMLVPHHEERWRSNHIVTASDIVEIKFNGPIDETLFQFPGPEPKKPR